jgi:hypothetical protein
MSIDILHLGTYNSLSQNKTIASTIWFVFECSPPFKARAFHFFFVVSAEGCGVRPSLMMIQQGREWCGAAWSVTCLGGISRGGRGVFAMLVPFPSIFFFNAERRRD